LVSTKKKIKEENEKEYKEDREGRQKKARWKKKKWERGKKTKWERGKGRGRLGKSKERGEEGGIDKDLNYVKSRIWLHCSIVFCKNNIALLNCPVPGKCNQNGVVYQATVESAGGRQDSYIGLAKFVKKKYPGHKKNLLDETAVGPTTLSKYFWKEQNAGRDPKVTWKFVLKKTCLYSTLSVKSADCA
jgi:hypothetical protein